MKFKCEFDNCKNVASSIHHIKCAYHGNKKRNEKGIDLIALCYSHHEYVHSINNFDTREKLENIAIKKTIK